MKNKNGGKEKANDWMWQSQRKTQLKDSEKGPKLKAKRCCNCISNKIFYTHPPSNHP